MAGGRMGKNKCLLPSVKGGVSVQFSRQIGDNLWRGVLNRGVMDGACAAIVGFCHFGFCTLVGTASYTTEF